MYKNICSGQKCSKGLLSSGKVLLGLVFIQQGVVEIKVEEEATKVLKSNEGFG